VDKPTASIRIAPGAPESTDGIALAVIAKAPVAGRSKTRLCPPCSSEQAAALAQAALLDTLSAVARTSAGRHVLVLDGEPGRWLDEALRQAGNEIDGFEVIAQRSGGLADRLAGAFADIGQATLLIGMDTPQITCALLHRGLHELSQAGNDAVLGRAHDGGYWAIGLTDPDPRVFAGVPMSTAGTADIQWRKLRMLGLSTVELDALRDVDYFRDALEVAAVNPSTRFARTLAPIATELQRVAA